MSQPIVAIVGRPNVGKSSLFNRFLRKKEAIVDDEPGITRDRHYTETDWNGKKFILIDTGGLVVNSKDVMEQEIKKHVEVALSEADVVLFVVDVESGITELDSQIANILQKTTKKVFLLVNKVDNNQRELEVGMFYKLGLGEPISVSAIAGRAIGDVLDKIVNCFPDNNVDVSLDENKEIMKLAIVGKPNVGKSSFINTVLGKERLIVTDIPGTTRDSINTKFKYYGEEIIIIDTAGLRKKSKIAEGVEFFSLLRTQKSIEQCDVAMVMYDVNEGLGSQDVKILEQSANKKRGIILVGNKWDLIDTEYKLTDEYKKELEKKLGALSYVPIIFISVKTKQRVFKVLESAKSIYLERKKRIQTSKLNDYFQSIFQTNPPASVKGKFINLNYVSQVKVAPPVFTFYTNEPKLIQQSYKSFLERKIREKFGFSGVPLTLQFRQK